MNGRKQRTTNRNKPEGRGHSFRSVSDTHEFTGTAGTTRKTHTTDQSRVNG